MQAGIRLSGAPCLSRGWGRRVPRQTPVGELGAGPGLWGPQGDLTLPWEPEKAFYRGSRVGFPEAGKQFYKKHRRGWGSGQPGQVRPR